MTEVSGMNHAPKGKPEAVVSKDEFVIAAIGLDHGHIYGMVNGCVEAGASLKWVYDKDPEKTDKFKQAYPEVNIAESKEQIYTDEEVNMVLSAAIASERSAIGNEAMRAGKDYFADKTAFTTFEQLDESKRVVQETGKRFFVYFGERLHVESAIYAGELINQGVIGDVLQVTGFGPHRLGKGNRPDWFFNKEQYGGILCDIGSHQIEQFLYYTNNTEAEVVHSKVANYANPDKPGLEDFGDATLVGGNGATFYFKVDWFT
ncbi:MAG: Gfo/Idh/MocA family oxidoreductase, partial [Bacteroidetes bacterium]|nr:Gfo/Idh/MocA family oxidoreductase [Bacteroidota bacterium]